jgi:hypothetical protein
MDGTQIRGLEQLVNQEHHIRLCVEVVAAPPQTQSSDHMLIFENEVMTKNKSSFVMAAAVSPQSDRESWPNVVNKHRRRPAVVPDLAPSAFSTCFREALPVRADRQRPRSIVW